MSWFVLALISIATTSVATLIARVLMKEEDSNPIATAIVFQFTLAAFVLIYALSFGRFVWPSVNDSPIRFLLSAFLWAGTTFFSLKGIKLLGAGESTILVSSSAIV